MCGLLGFSGDPKVMGDIAVQKLALAKMKILGLYNQDRGRHSCGIYVDNDVYKGVDDDKLFSDFIRNNDLPPVGETTGNYIVIGHTRMATHGIHSHANAHPFIVSDEDRKDSLVLAHNGVIRNVWNLCNKYKINHSEIKVDSLGLAHLIYKQGFKVLSEYEGFAALLMYKNTEPNSLYIYRGMSRLITDGELREERPLYYMQTFEGMYVSSMETALLAISDDMNDKVKIVEGNTVHKVTNGKMTKSKFVIDRNSINIGVSTNTHGGSPTQNYPKQVGSAYNRTSSQGSQGSTTPSTNNGAGGTNTTNSRVGSAYRAEPQMSYEEDIVPLVWHETLPGRALKGKDKEPVIFYHMSRFWQCTSDEITLLHGHYYINKKGKIQDRKETISNPTHNWYFYEGVMMKNLANFNIALEDDDLKNITYNFACIVSKYSEFPVTNLRSDSTNRCKSASPFVRIRWYKDGKMCGNEGFTPKFCDRNYTLREGLLHNIGSNTKADKSPTIDTESLTRDRLLKSGSPTTGNKPAVLIDMPIIRKPPEFDSEMPFPPFPHPVKIETKVDTDLEDVTNFYRTWESIEEARSALTELQINALRYFICDVMAAEMTTYPESIHEDAVDVQLDMFFLMCIESKMSIIDMWDTEAYEDAFYYLKVAKDNPNGVYMERNRRDEEAPNDVCEFVPKPLDANPKDDVEPPFIDTIATDGGFMTETAKVPKNSNIQDIEPEEDATIDDDDDDEISDTVMYSMQDIVDNTCLSRECADELQAAIDSDTDSDLSNAVAKAAYTHSDALLKDLNEISKRYPNAEFSNYLVTRQMKSVR